MKTIVNIIRLGKLALMLRVDDLHPSRMSSAERLAGLEVLTDAAKPRMRACYPRLPSSIRVQHEHVARLHVDRLNRCRNIRENPQRKRRALQMPDTLITGPKMKR